MPAYIFGGQEYVNKRIVTGLTSFPAWLAVLILCCITLVSARAQQSSPPVSPTDTKTRKATPPAEVKITLNGLEMGTTSDLSRLQKTLADVFKRRETEGVYKQGSSDIEKTTLIRANPSLKIREVLSVINVVKDAGASPVQLAIEGNSKKAVISRPNPLILAVAIGEPGFAPTTVFLGGLDLLLSEFTIKHSESDTLPKEFLVVAIPKEGEYVIDGKPIAKTALHSELQTRLQGRQDKRVVILIEKDSEITYGSLAEAAQAAFAAHADMLQLLALEG
jgi:biopolymer transport protein ExbD